MKKVLSLIAACCFLLLVQAQKKFDSAAYIQFYNSKWERYQYSPYNKIPKLSDAEKIAGLSKAWAEARFNFANFDLVPTLNWDSVYQAYIPKVMAAKDTRAYYKVLRNFYRHLHDGHTGILLPADFFAHYEAALPLEFRWVEGKAIVTTNFSTSPHDQQIRPGMELTAIEGQATQTYINQEISPYISYSTPQDSTERIYRYELSPGKTGSSMTLSFRSSDGATCTQVVKRVPMQQLQDRYPLVQFKVLPGNMGYLTLNSFNDTNVVRLFDSLFAQISTTDALIIDIRNNGGGNGQNGFEVLGCLTDKAFFPGVTALRRYRPVGREWGDVESIETEGYDWKPYKNKLYAKPVVLLTSGATYSAAEDFITAFRSINRGQIVGSATGGSTGQPVSFSLPGGGFGRVCAKRDYLWDKTEFVGIGIQPDQVVEPTIKGVAAGRDEVLEAAVKLLTSKPATAAK